MPTTPKQPTDESLSPERLLAHVRILRRLDLAAGCVVAFGAVAQFFLPRVASSLAGPTEITLLVAAAALWIGLSANRDARTRMERIRRAYTVHRDLENLLHDHLGSYLVVLLRVVLIAAAGAAVAVWGRGPGFGFLLFALSLMLIAMAWPTHHKLQLLIRRARAMLEEE